jgi:hypothetical protein
MDDDDDEENNKQVNERIEDSFVEVKSNEHDAPN